MNGEKMKRMNISEKTRQIYRWIDRNEHLLKDDNKALYEAFPEMNKGTLGFHKSRWKSYIQKGVWPDEVDIDPTTCSTSSLVDQLRDQNKKMRAILKGSENRKYENRRQAEKKGQQSGFSDLNIKSFIQELSGKKDLLLNLLNEYEERGINSPLDIHIVKPFKTVSYSLMEVLHNDFINACKRIGISQRKAIHISIQDFIRSTRSKGSGHNDGK